MNRLRRPWLPVVAAIGAAIVSCNPIPEGRIATATAPASDSIATAQAATATAVRLTRLDRLTDSPPTAERQIIESDSIPFVGSKLKGRAVWRVEFAKVRLYDSLRPSAHDKHVRTFVVLIDAATGRFLGAEATYEGEPAHAALPNPFETPDGPPSLPPTVTLADAIQTIAEKGMANPLIADAITVSFARSPAAYMRGASDAWAIDCYGEDYPVNIHGGAYMRDGKIVTFPPDSVTYESDHIRHVVDAQSGAILMKSAVAKVKHH